MKSLAITTILLIALLFLMFYVGYSYIEPPKHENTTVFIEITAEDLMEETSVSQSSSGQSMEGTASGENMLTNDEEEVILPKGTESKAAMGQPREQVRHIESLSKEIAMTGETQKISTAFNITTIQKDKTNKVYKVGNSDTTTIGIIRFHCKCDDNSHYDCKNQRVIRGTEAYYNKLSRDGHKVRAYKGY